MPSGRGDPEKELALPSAKPEPVNSAILNSVIESRRRRKIDPYAHLRDVLTRLPHMTNRQIPEVTPAA